MKLIVGLGNPGRKYDRTRHNVGWWVIDHLADVWRFGPWHGSGETLACEGSVGGLRVRLCKPQSYMNLSGQAIRPLVRRAGFEVPRDLLIVVDEVQLPVGRFRLRANGSAGGHNGLKDVEHMLAHRQYARLRIGVGPTHPEAQVRDLSDYVLGPMGSAERDTIVGLMPQLEGACETWVRDGVLAAMNAYNRPSPAAGTD
ncbi:MAG: aminoacyl-tRNA hydrolase [Gemmatimonadetes bacterium]|nr:aminoacyl-tRNA hydrolase [Gemmatimonadota bacterium]